MEIKVFFEPEDIEKLCIEACKKLTGEAGEYVADARKTTYDFPRMTVTFTPEEKPTEEAGEESATAEQVAAALASIPVPLGGAIPGAAAAPDEDPF